MSSILTEAGIAQFHDVMNAYDGNLYEQARRITGSHLIADEVAQTTTLKILTHPDLATGLSNGYINRINRNAAIDARRKRGNEAKTELYSDMSLIEAPSLASFTLSEPEAAYEIVECADEVQVAIGALNPDQQTIVRLYMSGLGVFKIAEALEIPVGTVKSRWSRARAALALSLKLYR